jgi:hypothetical protein
MCTGICKPGSGQCVNKSAQVCTSDGMTWMTLATCTYVCDMGACKGICNPGTKQCTNNMAQLCDANGQWANAGNCARGCAADGSCNP